jgi:hypothetical protein
MSAMGAVKKSLAVSTTIFTRLCMPKKAMNMHLSNPAKE